MAESNSPRLGLRRWSDGSDTPSRVEFDTDNANLELLAAIDKQDTFANRPAPGVRGTYFADTTNGYVWRDNGSAWSVVGSRTLDTIVRSSAIGNVPLTVDAIASQTANLLDLKVNAVSKASITKDGNLTAGTVSGLSSSFVNTVTGNVVVAGKGASGQTANLLELKNNANSNMFVVSPTGQATSPFAKLDAASVLNASSSTNVANMANWSGTPAAEVRMTGAGAFNDFMYLKHDVADASAATRRLGLVMKAGAEDTAGASRSGAVYLQSTAASFDNPALRIDVANTNIWSMDLASGSVTAQPVHANGAYLRATPSGTGGVQVASTWMGAQASGNSQYFRSGTTGSGFYWYAGGTHSDSAGANGGGLTLASLSSVGSAGVFTTGSLGADSATTVSAVQSSPAFRIGPASGTNVIGDSTGFLARNNGVVSELKLNAVGGKVSINGLDSQRGETRLDIISFSNKASHTFNKTFAYVYPVPPHVHVNVNSGAGETSEWIASAYNITETGCTIWVRSATNTPASWSSIPVQWSVNAR